jgi:hypothetical protein
MGHLRLVPKVFLLTLPWQPHILAHMNTSPHDDKRLSIRLNLSREEYAAFRHYCIDRGESGAVIVSAHIRKLIRRGKGQSGEGIAAATGGDSAAAEVE